MTHLTLANDTFADNADPGGVRPNLAAATVSAASLSPKPIEWLWQDRIPFGAITVLAGNPGLGKSLLTLKLIADLSQGRLTDRREHALLLSAEDAREQVVLPRLFAAGANMSRVHFDNVEEHELRRQLFLPDDVPVLGEMVERHHARLVVIDPLTAHLNRRVDSWRDHSIRLALAPLAQLAERSGAAIVVVGHLNKGQSSDPLQRLGGSIGLAAAARSVLLLDRDPDDPDGETGSDRVLAQIKTNLGEIADSLRYRVETVQLPQERFGLEIETARITETGRSVYSGSDLLAPVQTEAAGATAEAIRFLREELADGPKPVKELEQAATDASLSWETVRRAKSRARVRSVKQRGVPNGPWAWTLEDDTEQEPAKEPLAA